MTDTQTLSLAEIEDLSFRALTAAGTTAANARSLAHATAETEAMGVASHGLAYIPIYCEHVQCGKVDGTATPVVTQPRPAMIAVDAGTGFAHPAIGAGFERLVPLARQTGVAALAIHDSYNCGVLGIHTWQLAEAGLVGLGFTNAPASIAPSGGAKPVIGTNPFSIAAPGPDGPTLMIDQSASTIARSEVMKHHNEGRPIPEGWALDAQGAPTTDPAAVLNGGSMAPSGGYKGVGVGLLVETLAAALTGASLGIHAAPFSGTKGGPPRTGQMFIAFDPSAATEAFAERMTALAEAIGAQPGARLPGRHRLALRDKALNDGVAVRTATLDRIARFLS